jgi:hypothetical protein
MLDLAAQLRALADRLDALTPAQVVGELEAIKVSVLLAATPTAPTIAGPDPFALLTDEAVAAVLGVPTGTVVLLRQRGLLPGVPVGDKYVRTRRRDLERFVDGLPSALYSRKYAHQTHASSPPAPDGRGDAAPAAPPARLDASGTRRGARRDG